MLGDLSDFGRDSKTVPRISIKDSYQLFNHSDNKQEYSRFLMTGTVVSYSEDSIIIGND